MFLHSVKHVRCSVADHVQGMNAAVIVFNIKSIIHRFIKKIGLQSESFTEDMNIMEKKFFDWVQIDFFCMKFKGHQKSQRIQCPDNPYCEILCKFYK